MRCLINVIQRSNSLAAALHGTGPSWLTAAMNASLCNVDEATSFAPSTSQNHYLNATYIEDFRFGLLIFIQDPVGFFAKNLGKNGRPEILHFKYIKQ